MILGLDDSVGGAALSWDVTIETRESASITISIEFSSIKDQILGRRTDPQVLPCRFPYCRLF